MTETSRVQRLERGPSAFYDLEHEAFKTEVLDLLHSIRMACWLIAGTLVWSVLAVVMVVLIHA